MPTTVQVQGCGDDIVHAIVREGLPVFLEQMERAERSLPRFVIEELNRFLRCGDPEVGFAWLQCHDCDHHKLVPFSCSGRAFCPSCGGRRMAERAADLVDRVIPHVGVRQWVLTVPWPRRFLLARHPDLTRKVLATAIAEIFTWYGAATGRADGKSGSITAIQRFASALRLNVHFHILALDGCFTEEPGGRVPFHRARQPSTADVQEIVTRISQKTEALFAAEGFGPDDETFGDPDDGQELVQAASLAGRVGLGRRAGRRTRRVITLGGREYTLPERCAISDGYNLHAAVSIGPKDPVGLERLVRYICRPALAKSRLERRADGMVVLNMKRAWSDGTRAIVFTPAEFVARLAALVPPPQKNMLLYHGVLGPNAALRSRVVPRPTSAQTKEPEEEPDVLVRPERRAKHRRRSRTWAELLMRVFGVEAWRCPHCWRPMVLRAVVIHPPATTKILRGLTRSSRGPPAQSTMAPSA